jgi:hypothetical protein
MKEKRSYAKLAKDAKGNPNHEMARNLTSGNLAGKGCSKSSLEVSAAIIAEALSEGQFQFLTIAPDADRIDI